MCPCRIVYNCLKSSDAKRFIHICDNKTVKVEAIGTFRLLLKIRFYLDLNKIFIVHLLNGI